VFKILNGWERVQESDFFRRDESGRRRHTHKLFKTWVSLDIAKFSCSLKKRATELCNRICEQWNYLPGDVVSSSSVNIFKVRLDNYIRTIGGSS